MKKIIITMLCVILVFSVMGCHGKTPVSDINGSNENTEEKLTIPWDITGEYFLSYVNNALEKNEEEKFDKTNAPKMLYIDSKDKATEAGRLECYVLGFENFQTEQLEPIIKASNSQDEKEIYVVFKTHFKDNSSKNEYDLKVTILNENMVYYTVTDKENNLIVSYEFTKAIIRNGSYKYFNTETQEEYPLFINQDGHKYSINFMNRYKADDFAENFNVDNGIPVQNGVLYENIKLKDEVGEFENASMDMFLSNPLNMYNTVEIKFYKDSRQEEPEIFFLYSILDESAWEYDYCGEYYKDDEHSTSEKITVYKNSLDIDGRYTMNFDVEDLFMGWRPLEITDNETGEVSFAKVSVYFDDKKAYFSVYSVNGDYDIYARGDKKLK